jgi:1-acyl-sn-glycerol-3-phosphate acyltransferase
MFHRPPLYPRACLPLPGCGCAGHESTSRQSDQAYRPDHARAFETIDAALSNDELVLIFPEGRITYDGVFNEFKTGYRKILQRRAVPLIPMSLDGLWGSVFSRKLGARSLKFLLGELWLPVTVTVGEAISDGIPEPEELREQVQQLMGKASVQITAIAGENG